MTGSEALRAYDLAPVREEKAAKRMVWEAAYADFPTTLSKLF